MKKEGVFFIFVLVFLLFGMIFSIGLAKADDIQGMPVSQQNLNNVVGGVDKATAAAQNGYADTQNPADLNKDWTAQLEANSQTSGVSEVVIAIGNFLELFNPFYKLVFGMEYALSFAFAFAVAIWLILFFILYPIASSLFKSKLFGFIGAFCIVSLIGLVGIIKRVVGIFVTITSTKALLITLLIFVAILILMYLFRSYIRKWTKEEAQEQEAKDKAIFHAEAENIKRKYEEIKFKQEKT